MELSPEEKILNYLRECVQMDAAEEAEVLKYIPYKVFKKGSVLLSEGEVATACYFVLNGLVRQYELIDGEERCTYFYTEGDPLVSFESEQGQPAKYYWICEEDCLLIVGSYDIQDEAYANHPKLEAMSRMFMGKEFGKYHHLISSFITLNPEERYQLLVDTRPDLIQRVPQYHLASYLGIKPETLSRIRKRLTVKS